MTQNPAPPPPQVQPFKYALRVKGLTRCPPPKLGNSISVSYRFAFANLHDPRNFLPTSLINPQRKIPVAGKPDAPITDCCEAWALSMFTSLDDLKSKLKVAKSAAPMLMKRLGDHYVELALTPACGNHTSPNKFGHFDFFERASFVGLSAVVKHGKLAL